MESLSDYKKQKAEFLIDIQKYIAPKIQKQIEQNKESILSKNKKILELALKGKFINSDMIDYQAELITLASQNKILLKLLSCYVDKKEIDEIIGVEGGQFLLEIEKKHYYIEYFYDLPVLKASPIPIEEGAQLISHQAVMNDADG